MAALLDPICRAETDRMRAADPSWRRLLDHLAMAGPSDIESLRLELRLKRQELKALRSPLERCGVIVSRSVAMTSERGDGHTHASELSLWAQAYPDGAVPLAEPADPTSALADLLVAAVKGAVLAPESELRRWFSWSWYWTPALVDDLIRDARLRRLDGCVTADLHSWYICAHERSHRPGRQDGQVHRLVVAALDRHQRIDGLVNNPGASLHGPLDKVRPAEFDRILQLNVVSVLAVTQAVLHAQRGTAPGIASPRPGMVVHSPDYVAGFVLRLLRTGEESFDVPHGPEQPGLA
jgi:hypothetical protein